MVEKQGEKGSDWVPGFVKEIKTKEPYHESGILVELENGMIGRVKVIGTESSYKKPIELIVILEKKFRKLIVDVLSESDPNWWDTIHPKVKEKAEEKHSKGKDYKKLLQIPNYELIEETEFSDIPIIVTGDKNWSNHFEKIFLNREALKVKFEELAPYRNLPAHSKDVTEHIEKKIQVYYDDFVYLIEEYYRNKPS